MTESLFQSLGAYGGSFVVAFLSGLFPLASIEVFLVMITGLTAPTFGTMLVYCLFASAGHQLSKTITFYAGAGALEHGKIKQKLDEVRPRIEKWNKAPRIVLFVSGAIGIPPLYIIGFIARPLMGIGIGWFTFLILVTRFGRFVVLAGIPLLL
jgi:membrane protein YqaA with SNARE-associated domain